MHETRTDARKRSMRSAITLRARTAAPISISQRDVAYVGNSPAGARVIYLPESGFVGARFECNDAACAGLIFEAGAPTYGHPERNTWLLLAHPELATTLLHGVTDPAERAMLLEDWDRGAPGPAPGQSGTHPPRACPPRRPTARRSMSGANAARQFLLARVREGAGVADAIAALDALRTEDPPAYARLMCGPDIRNRRRFRKYWSAIPIEVRNAARAEGARALAAGARSGIRPVGSPPAPAAAMTALPGPADAHASGPTPRWRGCPRGVLRMSARGSCPRMSAWRFADVRVAVCRWRRPPRTPARRRPGDVRWPGRCPRGIRRRAAPGDTGASHRDKASYGRCPAAGIRPRKESALTMTTTHARARTDDDARHAPAGAGASASSPGCIACTGSPVRPRAMSGPAAGAGAPTRCSCRARAPGSRAR